MKVFVVIEHGTFEFESTIQTKVFSTIELARKEWEDRVELAEEDADNFLDDDERVIIKDEERMSFDAYKDGYASEWGIEIYVEEKEIDE